MASQFYTPKVRTGVQDRVALGPQPFNRDNIFLAFGISARPVSAISGPNGQDLAGSGALVFEGEMLELPRTN